MIYLIVTIFSELTGFGFTPLCEKDFDFQEKDLW